MSSLAAATPALQVTGLRAGYGDVTVIQGLDLSVPAGEVAVIIGPNGHGKTTLLRAVSGLPLLTGEQHDAGSRRR